MTNSVAKEYLDVINQIRELEKRKEKLRPLVLGLMGSNPALMIDQILITREDRERTSIDRERIIADYGASFLEKYTKKTSYIELRCKSLK